MSAFTSYGHTRSIPAPTLCAKAPSAPQQTACLLGGLPNLHSPWHSDNPNNETNRGLRIAKHKGAR
jgi:hypothetical protein